MGYKPGISGVAYLRICIIYLVIHTATRGTYCILETSIEKMRNYHFRSEIPLDTKVCPPAPGR